MYGLTDEEFDDILKQCSVKEYKPQTATSSEFYSCRNCGKEFSNDMKFRIDKYKRNICPVCGHRTIEIKSGSLDNFYD